MLVAFVVASNHEKDRAGINFIYGVEKKGKREMTYVHITYCLGIKRL